jgi:hypothetical protein
MGPRVGGGTGGCCGGGDSCDYTKGEGSPCSLTPVAGIAHAFAHYMVYTFQLRCTFELFVHGSVIQDKGQTEKGSSPHPESLGTQSITVSHAVHKR